MKTEEGSFFVISVMDPRIARCEFFIGPGTVRSEILRSQDLDASGSLKLQNLRSYEDHLDKFLEKIKIEVTDHMVESLNTEMKN